MMYLCHPMTSGTKCSQFRNQVICANNLNAQIGDECSYTIRFRERKMCRMHELLEPRANLRFLGAVIHLSSKKKSSLAYWNMSMSCKRNSCATTNEVLSLSTCASTSGKQMTPWREKSGSLFHTERQPSCIVCVELIILQLNLHVSQRCFKNH